MSDSKTGARPSQVTMAAWVAVVGSALLVLTLFDSIAQVRSVEVRDSVEEFLATPPGSGLGLEIPQVVEILRVLMLFTGAAAAVALVLAIYVLQRNNAARIGFTGAAAAIMLTAPLSGGFLPIMIGFAAMMLWTRPARDWFNGTRTATTSTRKEGRFVSSEHPEPPQDEGRDTWPRMPEGSPDHPLPPPTEGFGAQPPQKVAQDSPSAGWAPPAYPQQGQYGDYPGSARPAEQDKRPTTVTLAAVLTWVFAGLTTAAFVLIDLVLVVARDQFVEQIGRQPGFSDLNMSTNELIAGLWILSAVVVFWSLSAMVLAFFAFRRANWARITLVASSGITALFTLAAFPLGLLHAVAAIAVAILLFAGGANQWFSPRRFPPGGYGGYGQPPYGQQQGQYGQQQGPYGQPPQAPPQDRPQGEQKPPKNVW